MFGLLTKLSLDPFNKSVMSTKLESFYLTGEEREAQRGSVICPGYTAVKNKLK